LQFEKTFFLTAYWTFSAAAFSVKVIIDFAGSSASWFEALFKPQWIFSSFHTIRSASNRRFGRGAFAL